MNISKLVCLTVGYLLIHTVSRSSAAKILVATVLPMKSHAMMNNAIVSELLTRGHEVTFITNFSLGKSLGPNYTEVLIDPVFPVWNEIQRTIKRKNPLDLDDLSLRETIQVIELAGYKSTEHALQQRKVREVFERNDTENVYDLLMVPQLHNEAFLVLAVKYNIPVITYCAMGYGNYMSQMMGVVTPWSFVPHGLLEFDDRMSFWERFQNTLASLYDDFYREFIAFPKQDALVKKYLSHLPIKIPKASKMEKNISLMLLNSHVPLTTPRPTSMAMIPVGGMHIYPVKPLPPSMQQFLDEATHGAIYFSLGSNIPSSEMSPERLSIFLDVFASMKQRVLWKFEDENFAHLPQNVMVKKWMPQNDILAHPNVKVFITHGGLFGTQEGVFYGVPMLGIPFFFDQYLNVHKISKAGYGLGLRFATLTRESLKGSLSELIENPSYRRSVQRASEIFRDRPQSPRDTAMYWIEYVIRHKGAPHLRPAGLDLAWYEFCLLDLLGVTLFGITAAAALLFRVLRTVREMKKTKLKTT